MRSNTRTVLIITSVLLVLVVVGGVLSLRQPFQERKARGLTKAEWLNRLAPKHFKNAGPLQIVNVSKVAQSDDFAVEVALSYDSLIQNDFLEGSNVIQLFIESEISGYLQFYRTANGNCFLQLAPGKLHPGTNQIQAVLWITDPADKDYYLEIIGPPISYVFTKSTSQ